MRDKTMEIPTREMLAINIRKALLSYGQKPRIPGEIYITEVINCLRRAFFNIVFNANPVSTANAFVGKLFHSAIPRILGDVFKGAEYEVPVTYDLGGGWYLAGRADVVKDGVVYEFKFGSPYSEAKPLYIMQANAYAILLNTKKFYLVMIDKRKLTVEVDEGEPDEELFKQVIKRAYTLLQALKNETPPAPAEMEWMCDNCPYNIICKRYTSWLLNKQLPTGGGSL